MHNYNTTIETSSQNYGDNKYTQDDDKIFIYLYLEV